MQHRRYFVETEGNETERVRKKWNEMEQSSYLIETERKEKNDTNHSPNLFHSVSFSSVSFRFGIKNSWPPPLVPSGFFQRLREAWAQNVQN